jgi:ubiquinol-cytochrome c reductase cytochrome c subunit
MRFSYTVPTAFLLVASISASPPKLVASFQQASDDGRALFDAQCRACHNTGSERLIGPGLLGITERRDRSWLLAFITAPDRLIAEGDSIAAELLEEYQVPMPNLGLSEAQAAAILDYLAGTEAPVTAPAAPPSAVSNGDAAVGSALFTGERRLEGGGAACISCHDVVGLGSLGGGTMAKDVTASANLYGASLPALLEAPPFPAMQAVYASRPLTGDEIADLSAFLAEAERGEVAARPRLPFAAAGLGGMVLLTALAGLLWRDRLRGVRKPLIGEQR